MKIKILSSSPLNPLNKLFPEGIPILDGVELGVQGTNAYVFDPTDVSKVVLSQVASVAMADNVPVIIAFVVMHHGELIIPKEWICTGEQSTTAS